MDARHAIRRLRVSWAVVVVVALIAALIVVSQVRNSPTISPQGRSGSRISASLADSTTACPVGAICIPTTITLFGSTDQRSFNGQVNSSDRGCKQDRDVDLMKDGKQIKSTKTDTNGNYNFSFSKSQGHGIYTSKARGKKLGHYKNPKFCDEATSAPLNL